MGDILIMSRKERLRKVVMEQILSDQISLSDAARRLELSYRQLKRIKARYKAQGDVGLVHKSRGKSSNRGVDESFKTKVLMLYQEHYLDFGPTFAAEKLFERDQLKVNAETLRLWLMSAGLWHKQRKCKAHRSRRLRRGRYGEMLQLDGSIHSWLPGSDEKQCLMNMVDDATTKSLAIMDSGETTRAAFALLRWWITEAGIPQSIYVDLKSLYISPKSLRIDEFGELVEPQWLTHFSRACTRLGIKVIKAYSAQAKGRVERNHAVYQDRLIKELKLHDIKSIEQANEFLSNGFVNKLNEKFAKEPRELEDAHVHLLEGDDLDQILCWEHVRQLRNDGTIHFEGNVYQLTMSRGQSIRPKTKITVRVHMDHAITLWHHDVKLAYTPIESQSKKAELTKVRREVSSSLRAHNARLSKARSPWSKFNPHWLQGPLLKGHNAFKGKECGHGD